MFLHQERANIVIKHIKILKLYFQHLLKIWKVEKPKGRSYKATMSLARKSYKRGGKAKDAEAEAAPKKRRRRKKKAN